jgi:hypothetical protein
MRRDPCFSKESSGFLALPTIAFLKSPKAFLHITPILRPGELLCGPHLHHLIAQYDVLSNIALLKKDRYEISFGVIDERILSPRLRYFWIFSLSETNANS